MQRVAQISLLSAPSIGLKLCCRALLGRATPEKYLCSGHCQHAKRFPEWHGIWHTHPLNLFVGEILPWAGNDLKQSLDAYARYKCYSVCVAIRSSPANTLMEILCDNREILVTDAMYRCSFTLKRRAMFYCWLLLQIVCLLLCLHSWLFDFLWRSVETLSIFLCNHLEGVYHCSIKVLQRNMVNQL